MHGDDSSFLPRYGVEVLISLLSNDGSRSSVVLSLVECKQCVYPEGVALKKNFLHGTVGSGHVALPCLRRRQRDQRSSTKTMTRLQLHLAIRFLGNCNGDNVDPTRRKKRSCTAAFVLAHA